MGAMSDYLMEKMEKEGSRSSGKCFNCDELLTADEAHQEMCFSCYCGDFEGKERD